MQTCLKSRHFLVFICLHIFKGKPKLRTNLNVGPNLLLEWLYLFRKKGDDKKIKQPNPFSKITDESELVFSGEEEMTPVCSRELCTYFKNNVQIPRSWQSFESGPQRGSISPLCPLCRGTATLNSEGSLFLWLRHQGLSFPEWPALWITKHLK